MSARETRTILLVDSSATTLFYHAMLLKRLEYKVVTTQSANDALRLIDQAPPSIIVAELTLPDLKEINFVKQLKDSSRFKAIPVVVLTSRYDPGAQDTCLRLGCAGCLSKPVEPDVLYKTIQAASEIIPRANIRLNASLAVVVGDGSATGGAKHAERTTVISEGGLYISTLSPPPRNAVVPLRITVDQREIHAKAVVLYTHSEGDGSSEGPGMGMKFVEISEPDRDFIRRYIKDQITRDIAV